MATVYQNPSLTADGAHAGSDCSHGNEGPQHGYNGYVEPNTKIPPKAKPMLAEVSVNGVKLPEADILQEAQLHPAENPGAALAAATRALVIRELLLQEAKALRIDAKPETDGGKVETDTDARIRGLIELEVKVPNTTSAECRRYYDNNPRAFAAETIYEARHILLPVKSDDLGRIQAVETEAKAIIRHLVGNPRDFARIARDVSACTSKEHGGNLGQITRGSTVSEFEAALEQMQPGQLCPEPVRSRFGFHVIHLDHKVPGDTLPFTYVEERISAWLEASSWSRAVAQYISILAGKAEIKGIDLNTASSPLVQ